MEQLTAQACEWAESHFLFFSENVFDPVIYYSHFTPAIAAMILSLLVFLGRKNNELAVRYFIVANAAFIIWVMADLVLWASESIPTIMFVWSAQIFFELMFYIGIAYFTYIFVYQKDVPAFSKMLTVILFVPLAVLGHTQLNLIGFDFTNCDREAIEGPLWQWIYIMELALIGVVLVSGLYGALKHPTSKEHRAASLWIVGGSVLLLMSFSLGNIIGSFTLDWDLGQYGLFGMPIFAICLAFVVVRYKAFATQVVGAQLLVIGLIVLTGSQMFFVNSTVNLILTALTLFLVCVAGLLLTRAVQNSTQKNIDLERTSKQLAQANASLRKLDNAKSEFISIASHQLRTPLTAIKGYITLMLEGSYGKCDERATEGLGKIYQANERLINLVEDLLNISRIESGRLEYKFKPVQIADILNELYDTFVLRAKEAGLTFSIALPQQEIGTVEMDQAKVTEVISNLIDNAIKYTKEGSITVTLLQDGPWACVEVRDTGIGIPEGSLKNIFQKFSRGEDPSRLHVDGTGLGLYVGQNLVRKHHGAITVASPGEGKGSTFTLKLPFQQPR